LRSGSSDAAEQLTSWDQIKLLTVRVSQLKKWWRDGLLCIADAAHAMSPVGGVVVNLAIKDAVILACLGRMTARSTFSMMVEGACERKQSACQSNLD